MDRLPIYLCIFLQPAMDYGPLTIASLIQQPEFNGVLNSFQFVQYLGIVAFIYIGYHIADLCVSHQKFADNINVMPRKNIVNFSQDARHVFMDMN